MGIVLHWFQPTNGDSHLEEVHQVGEGLMPEPQRRGLLNIQNDDNQPGG